MSGRILAFARNSGSQDFPQEVRSQEFRGKFAHRNFTGKTFLPGKYMVYLNLVLKTTYTGNVKYTLCSWRKDYGL